MSLGCSQGGLLGEDVGPLFRVGVTLVAREVGGGIDVHSSTSSLDLSLVKSGAKASWMAQERVGLSSWFKVAVGGAWSVG